MKLNLVRRGPVSVRASPAMFLSNKFGNHKEHLSAMDSHYLKSLLLVRFEPWISGSNEKIVNGQNRTKDLWKTYPSIYPISQQHHQQIVALLNQFFQVAANWI